MTVNVFGKGFWYSVDLDPDDVDDFVEAQEAEGATCDVEEDDSFSLCAKMSLTGKKQLGGAKMKLTGAKMKP